MRSARVTALGRVQGVLSESDRPLFASYVRRTLSPVLERIGYTPQSGEAQPLTIVEWLAAPASRLEFDGLTIDLTTREVMVKGQPIATTAKEFDLLAFLASSPRQVFSREQLLEHVWQSSSAWQSADTVTEHIRRLRKRIEDDPEHPRWIATVWSVGYRFEPG